MHVTTDNTTTIAWFAILGLSIFAISAAFEPKAYLLGPELRAFIGLFGIYASLNVLVNKAIAYGCIR